MLSTKIINSITILISGFILLLDQNHFIQGASAAIVNLDSQMARRPPLSHVPARLPIHYNNKIRTESLSDFFDDDDLLDFNKRQLTDDYGHLRFGKRGDDADDYRRWRLGRTAAEKK